MELHEFHGTLLKPAITQRFIIGRGEGTVSHRDRDFRGRRRGSKSFEEAGQVFLWDDRNQVVGSRRLSCLRKSIVLERGGLAELGSGQPHSPMIIEFPSGLDSAFADSYRSGQATGKPQTNLKIEWTLERNEN